MSGDHLGKLVIGISGLIRKPIWLPHVQATNSGKSTLVEQLVSALPICSVLHQDNYYLESGDERLTWIPELNHENWDEMKALDMDRIVSDIQQWVRDTHLPGGNSKSILLVDGFLLYNYRPLNELFNKRYFLTVSHNVCKERRSERNYEPPDVPGYFDQIVWPAYLENLEEIKDMPDITFLDGTNTKEDIFQNVLKGILSVIHSTH